MYIIDLFKHCQSNIKISNYGGFFRAEMNLQTFYLR